MESSFYLKDGNFSTWYVWYEDEQGHNTIYSGPHCTLSKAKRSMRIACIQHGHEIPEWIKPWYVRVFNVIAEGVL